MSTESHLIIIGKCDYLQDRLDECRSTAMLAGEAEDNNNLSSQADGARDELIAALTTAASGVANKQEQLQNLL